MFAVCNTTAFRGTIASMCQRILLFSTTAFAAVAVGVVFPPDVPFLAWSFFAAAIILVFNSIQPNECYFALLIFLTTAAVRHWLGLPILLASGMLMWIGISSISVLTIKAATSDSNTHQAQRSELLIAFAIPLFALVAALHNRLTAISHPQTQDLNLYLFDAVFGFQPSFAIGRLLVSRPLLQWFSELCYDALPSGMALVCVLTTSKGRRWRWLAVMAIAPVIASILTHLVPAVGPSFAFSNFPNDRPGAIPNSSIPLDIPRNCIPSMHLAWVLLMLWNCGRLSTKVIAWLFVIGTLLATLGFGQHYLVDLIIAVPFAVAAQAAALRSWRSCLVNSSIVLIWIGSFAMQLRPRTPIEIWIISVLTLGFALVSYFYALRPRFCGVLRSDCE